MSEEKKKNIDKDIEENKIIAAIAYLGVLCLVPLLLKRNSKFAQFHGKQGLVLFIVDIVLMFFAWIPLFGQLLMLLLMVVSIIGVVKTANGEWWKIPYLYEWSKKLNL